MEIIARIHNGYTEKFGIPRQSGIVKNLSKIVFEPKYRVREAFSGLESFSHVWIIWNFSMAERETWSPTVRPPKLGGNERVGVFATRSPYRPNPIGLSCVELVKIDFDEKNGPILTVRGADLMDGTPIFDIKPYVSYTDRIENAVSGFALSPNKNQCLVTVAKSVHADDELLNEIIEILKQDPKPAYKEDADRIYKMTYADHKIEFTSFKGNITILNIHKNT